MTTNTGSTGSTPGTTPLPVPKKAAKSQKTRYADHIKEWEDLTVSLAPSATEAPQVEIQRAALQKMLDQAKDLTSQQALFQAQKQEASKQLVAVLVEGKRLASVLRATVKQHYGIRSEKLAQFGMQPFRGRTKKQAAPAPVTGTPQPHPQPTPGPSTGGSTPATHTPE